VSGLPTREACIVPLTIFTNWAGHNVLDLILGLVGILLPVRLELKLRLLPSTSLLNYLHILLRLKLALAVIIGWLIVMN
jgi:hypothetical protein